ncbi:RNA-dependent RNA polymerase [Fusarium poae narnavirus 2]|uniref:RNA-dependent RNA polymerase n=1 Tax=Fusarium poae narnavirus 2 TaxID=1849532 RepID=UPI000847D3F4|nr:RNA-dependent RNA polymerase [Fusarium poae narnavirus 2]BAV56296.1 RNA-dependent RNA polymerase [Fusarium poae narnavirus 2]
MDPPSPGSGGSGFATANESLSSASYRTADESARPWNNVQDVLSIEDLPSTVSLRRKFIAPCACLDRHRSFREFCQLVIDPSLRKDSIVPKIEICWNNLNLWESKLPRELTGLENRVLFEDMPSIWHAQKVLYNGTHWFRRLMRKTPNRGNFNGVAILRLLAGKSITGKERVDQLVHLPLVKSGCHKLRSILATVDGLVMQLVLSFPMWEELLSWDRMDQIIHCLICQLIPDYFRKEIPENLSSFEKIKRLRGAIKEQGFNPVGDISSIDIPREMSFFKVITDFMSDRKTPIDMYRVMVMSQTRAAGVPPRSVYLKSLQKIKETLTEPPDRSRYERVKGYVATGIDMIHREMVESIGSESESERFWARVISRAKISLSDSGEFFTNSESGGKLEAARLVLSQNKLIPEVDLETGAHTGRILGPDDQVGIRLFHWACNVFRDRKTVYDRNVMSVRVSLVAELAKYRAITVSHLAHAILLHVLSHVLLEYISAIPSSRSGVGAANHAWNFFKRLSHHNPAGKFIFERDVYVFSTDWEEATDWLDHLISQLIVNRLCNNVGIPTWYRQTVVFALCAPRQVEEIDPEEKVLSRYFTTRGELMGDPVVKVILHICHLVARYAAVKQLQKMVLKKHSLQRPAPS